MPATLITIGTRTHLFIEVTHLPCTPVCIHVVRLPITWITHSTTCFLHRGGFWPTSRRRTSFRFHFILISLGPTVFTSALWTLISTTNTTFVLTDIYCALSLALFGASSRILEIWISRITLLSMILFLISTIFAITRTVNFSILIKNTVVCSFVTVFSNFHFIISTPNYCAVTTTHRSIIIIISGRIALLLNAIWIQPYSAISTGIASAIVIAARRITFTIVATFFCIITPTTRPYFVTWF